MLNVEVRVAVILACYNRSDRTLQCLDRLFRAAAQAPYAKLSVFLLDDASPDGTGDTVLQHYPTVRVIQGTGDLFWNRGMHRAMTIAMEEGFDYFYWLNDDTMLAESALANLIDTSNRIRERTGKDGIVVGTTETEFGSGVATYGGRVRPSRWRPLQFELVLPGAATTQCDTMNGNCVLIPASVVALVGALDPVFRHSMGDTDYGFRARKAGFDIWVMPGFAGACKKNPPEGEWVDRNVPLSRRLRKMVEPKALPLWPWAVYTWRHAGLLWPLVWAWPYLNVVRTSIIVACRRKEAVKSLQGIALAALVASGTYSFEVHAADSFLPQQIDRNFFGMHIHWNDTSRQLAMPPIGILRLWDTRTSWCHLEPKRGQWDFDKLDKHVALAVENNLEVLMTLGAPPRWASLRPDQDGPYGPGTGEPPRNLEDWDNYVRTVATRYKGKIRNYEVLNEPVLIEHEKSCLTKRHFWCGSAAEMVEITRRTSEIVKSIDPNAKIVAPGFTGATSGRLDLFLDAGGGQYVDVIAHHFYALHPQQMLERINLVKKSMVNHGYGHLELWNTESGYTVGNIETHGGIAGVSNLDHETMRAYVAQSLALAASAGVRRYFWYAWDNGTTGMASPDGSRPLPGGIAYAAMRRWLMGKRVVDCREANRSLWTCLLTNGNREERIIWSTKPYEEVVLPDSWSGNSILSLDGSELTISTARSISVGLTPVLLTSSP